MGEGKWLQCNSKTYPINKLYFKVHKYSSIFSDPQHCIEGMFYLLPVQKVDLCWSINLLLNDSMITVFSTVLHHNMLDLHSLAHRYSNTPVCVCIMYIQFCTIFHYKNRPLLSHFDIDSKEISWTLLGLGILWSCSWKFSLILFSVTLVFINDYTDNWYIWTARF